MSADYEIPVMTLTDRAGRELRVVRRHIDAFGFSGLVRLLVYDSDDQVVAENALCRDVIVEQISPDSFRAFEISLRSYLFNRTWIFSGSLLIARHPLLGGL